MGAIDAWVDPFWIAYVVYGISGVILLLLVVVFCRRGCRKRQSPAVGVEAAPGGNPLYAFNSRGGFVSPELEPKARPVSEMLLESSIKEVQ